MPSQTKAWTLAILFGAIGVILSAGAFLAMIVYTKWVFGILTVAFGVLSGFLCALGFKVGKGSLATQKHVSLFLNLATLFGFLGVAGGYLGLVALVFASGDPQAWSVLRLSDLLFAALGAYGGRWAGEKFLVHQVNKQEAVKLEEHGAVKAIDDKFSS